MTRDNDTMAPGVTQADREAAAAICPIGLCSAILAGGMDKGKYVQAFARHRQTYIDALKEARAWVAVAEHDEDCELHPDFGEANLERANDEAEEEALDAGGDERDVTYRNWPDDAVCTCERGKSLATINELIGEE